MQQPDTKVSIDNATGVSGLPVTVIRFTGDISSTSREAVLGTYHGLPEPDRARILLDFSKVEYINSSGIALVIQMLLEAIESRSDCPGLRSDTPFSESIHDGRHHEIHLVVRGRTGRHRVALISMPRRSAIPLWLGLLLLASRAFAAGPRVVTTLDGPWAWQRGDNPLWAAPSFDDSSWPRMSAKDFFQRADSRPARRYFLVSSARSGAPH